MSVRGRTRIKRSSGTCSDSVTAATQIAELVEQRLRGRLPCRARQRQWLQVRHRRGQIDAVHHTGRRGDRCLGAHQRREGDEQLGPIDRFHACRCGGGPEPEIDQDRPTVVDRRGRSPARRARCASPHAVQCDDLAPGHVEQVGPDVVGARASRRSPATSAMANAIEPSAIGMTPRTAGQSTPPRRASISSSASCSTSTGQRARRTGVAGVAEQHAAIRPVQQVGVATVLCVHLHEPRSPAAVAR